MKKFLIAVLILIPIVVVLALTATGQVIKMTIKVEAKDIIIKDSTNKELQLEQTYILDLIGKNYLEVLIQVLPSISYNLNVIFRTTLESEGNVRVERQGNTFFYKIYPEKAGVCDLLVIAENNEEVKKTIHFYITTNALSEEESSIIVLSEQNKAFGGEVLDLTKVYQLTEPAKLFLDCYPVESIGGSDILWSSENERIAKVDQNGFVYPEGKGSTKIYALTSDKTGKVHIFTLKVDTSNAIAKMNSLSLTEDKITADYIADKILLQKGLRVEQEYDSFHIYNENDELVKIVHVNKVESEDLAILNEDYLDTVYIGIGGYQVNVDYLDYSSRGSLKGLSFASNNPEIATVNHLGKLQPLQQGNVTITVYLNGKQIAYKDIKVSARAITFRLTRDNQSNLVGIKQEYVWAYNWIKYNEEGKCILDQSYTYELLYSRLSGHFSNTYNGIKYSNKSALFLNTEGEKANLDNINLLWTVDNPAYAEIEQDGKLTFFQAVCGKEVTVTANETIYGIKTKLARQYTFKFVKDKEAVNVDTIEEFRGINEGYALTAVLHNSLFFDPDNPTKTPNYISEFNYLDIRGNVYGNGKAIKGRRAISSDGLIKIRVQAQYIDYNNSLEDQLKPLIIENLELNGWDEENVPYEQADGNNLIMDLIKVSYYYCYHNKYFDYQQRAHLEEPIDMRDKRVETAGLQINYCYIHNAVKGLTLFEMSNTTITGTIFSNLILCAISVENKFSSLASLTLNRIVMRDSISVGIVSVLNDEPPESNPYANKATRIVIKGFLDAYTWTRTTGFTSLGKVVAPGSLDGLSSVANTDALYAVIDEALAEVLRQIIEQHNLTLTYKGKDYAHLAILALGLWQDSTTDRIIDETKQFKKIPFNFDKKFAFIAPSIPIPISIAMLEALTSTTLTKQSIAVSYDIAKGNSNILPDTDCPSNTALYQRLQGTAI